MYILSFTATQIATQVWSAANRSLSEPVALNNASTGSYGTIATAARLTIRPGIGTIWKMYLGITTQATTGAGYIQVTDGVGFYTTVTLTANQSVQCSPVTSQNNYVQLWNTDSTNSMSYGYNAIYTN